MGGYDQWPEIFSNLKQVVAKEHEGLLTDIEEYVERLQLQKHRLEDHLKASETEIKNLKNDNAQPRASVVSIEPPQKGAYAPAPVKQSVEDLVEQVAKLKQEKEEMTKQKAVYEKIYNDEIEKIIRFKTTIQQHTEALSMQGKVENENVRRERDDLLFQNADDELSKAKMKTRLDDAIAQLRQLAELTEEQANAIEWLKTHKPDETTNRPPILDASRSSDHDDVSDDECDSSECFTDKAAGTKTAITSTTQKSKQETLLDSQSGVVHSSQKRKQGADSPKSKTNASQNETVVLQSPVGKAEGGTTGSKAGARKGSKDVRSSSKEKDSSQGGSKKMPPATGSSTSPKADHSEEREMVNGLGAMGVEDHGADDQVEVESTMNQTKAMPPTAINAEKIAGSGDILMESPKARQIKRQSDKKN